jgi:hypothetical protein
MQTGTRKSIASIETIATKAGLEEIELNIHVFF